MNLYTTATMVAAAECPMRGVRDPVEPGRCWWCGGALPKRRLRWCSDDCLRVYQDNHEWGATRLAVLARDGYICVRCGSNGGSELSCTCGADWPCGRVGQPFTDSDAFALGYDPGYREKHRRRVRSTGILEVNHIDPRMGRGYAPGCHHHLDGAETLCRPCHVEETRRQLREWRPPKPRKPEGGMREDRPPEAPSLTLWEVPA